MTEITLGGKSITPSSEAITRLTLLLWGDAGVGKTTFACTAPGKKLLINFDPNGPSAVAARDDVDVVDFSSEKYTIIDKLKGDDPIQISRFLADHPEYETVIIDSLTTIGDKALEAAVAHYRSRNSTMEAPGIHGYAHRNALMMQIINGFILQTARANRHLIMIAHEGSPEKNSEGIVLYVSTTLGDGVSKKAPIKLSEVWCMYDTGQEIRIAVRQVRSKKPMKTRMFDTTSEREFVWQFDPMKWKGLTIEQVWNEWLEDRSRKLQMPTAPKKGVKK